LNKIITIGAIGHTADSFFEALVEAGVDTLVDIRRRRAVRGRDYAFANSQRLQARLAELGIRYLHRLDLAPPPAARQQQHAADKAAGIATRKRTALSPDFVAIYDRAVLGSFDPDSLLADLPADARVVALMCVERRPEACHRSLLAARLQDALGVEVQHLIAEEESTDFTDDTDE
jgi:uncharacterized protein (DUF488 family)